MIAVEEKEQITSVKVLSKLSNERELLRILDSPNPLDENMIFFDSSPYLNVLMSATDKKRAYLWQYDTFNCFAFCQVEHEITAASVL